MSENDKRQDAISWDEYFMGICTLSAHRSKDPSTQVGACIVSPDHKILSMGYNGFPKGCSDDIFPWAKMKAEQDPYNAKYFYVTHAELNAILNYRGGSLEGATIYVTLFPCKGYYPIRHQNLGVLGGHICGYPRGKGLQAHAGCCRCTLLPLPAHRKKHYY